MAIQTGVVIGGGVIGLSAAEHLARKKVRQGFRDGKITPASTGQALAVAMKSCCSKHDKYFAQQLGGACFGDGRWVPAVELAEPCLHLRHDQPAGDANSSAVTSARRVKAGIVDLGAFALRTDYRYIGLWVRSHLWPAA